MNPLDLNTIYDYQPGGDTYYQIVSQYGQSAADQIAAIANDQTNSNARVDIANVLNLAKNGAPLNTSTTEILASQLYNDPFSAPIDQAAKIATNAAKAAGNAGKSVTSALLGNWGAWVIGALVLAVMFFHLGGGAVVRRKISKF